MAKLLISKGFTGKLLLFTGLGFMVLNTLWFDKTWLMNIGLLFALTGAGLLVNGGNSGRRKQP